VKDLWVKLSIIPKNINAKSSFLLCGVVVYMYFSKSEIKIRTFYYV